MHVVYSDQQLRIERPSLFLAGPTPRHRSVESWRPAALAILENLNFAGTVLVPERQHRQSRVRYMEQIQWEWAGLDNVSVIAFWVPRELVHLPGFTTNVEFGRYIGRKPCVYGRPDAAPKTRYLDALYEKEVQRQPCGTLEETLRLALEHAESESKTNIEDPKLMNGLLAGQVFPEKVSRRFE